MSPDCRFTFNTEKAKEGSFASTDFGKQRYPARKQCLYEFIVSEMHVHVDATWGRIVKVPRDRGRIVATGGGGGS